METLCCSTMTTPVGTLTLVVSERGVVRVEFGSSPSRFPRNVDLKASEADTRCCREQLEEYFSGQRTEFSLPLDLRGTEFQQSCWRALLQIPYGETRCYGDIARAVGRPRAFRAVGMANHDNPVAIVVPCHRVVGANGSLTGYGGGVETKRKLLELERVFRLSH